MPKPCSLRVAIRRHAPVAASLVLVASLALPSLLGAQALLVEDINTAGIDSVGFTSFGSDAVVVGMLHFFAGDDGVSGREPWVLHLDTGVAERLADLYPGPVSSAPEQFVRVGARALFVATSPGEGKELWITDGTAAGTELVEDIQPGVASSSPTGLFQIPGGRAVFSANDGLLGAELWVTDGTSGGTNLVEDINPGAPSSGPGQFALAGGILFFRAANAASGTELWRWTLGGVSQVADIEPGVGSSSPVQLYAVGTGIVFSACKTASGCEPWASDGTGPGTVQFADIHPSGGSYPYGFLWHPGLARLFFVAEDDVHGTELWQRVGGVTSRVTDLAPGLIDGLPNGLAALTTKLLFTGYDGSSGTRLYTYDGTTVAQIMNLSTAGPPSRPENTLPWNGRIYFLESGTCWFSDGTSAGTVAWQSSCYSSPPFTVGDGRLLYGTGSVGELELWSIDSADVEVQETDLASYSSNPGGFTWLGESTFFAADDGVSGSELWVSDGTPAGTALLDLNSGAAGSAPSSLTPFEGEIWFAATTPATGFELWHSDGTVGGTEVVELRTGSSGSSPSRFVVLGSTLFFVAYDELLGEQLFRIADAGSPAVMLDYANQSGLSPEKLVSTGDRLFFFGESSSTGRELFTIRENEAEPTPIEIVPGPGWPDDQDELVAWNGAAYFMADDGVTGRQIWRSDGVSVAPVSSLSGGSTPENLTAGPGGVYFVYADSAFGSELWRTDGVATVRISDINPLGGDAYPYHLTRVGNRLYFTAEEPVTGGELWWTDGVTVAQVADLRPGAGYSSPGGLVAAGDRLLFAADDGVNGRELWLAAATSVRRLPEVWPGVGASTPLAVAVDPAATRIFFSALGPSTWREPYRIDLQLFQDGFESANSTAWSTTVP
jgi:ELWxxDGT repeat protein